MEEPANELTPRRFAQRAQQLLSDLPNVTVHVRERPWIEEQSMRAYMAVAQGSAEPPVFLELHYRGKPQSANTETIDLGLVGKGITFDSGGISIKPSAGMAMMKADMGGAAVVLATLVQHR